METPVEYKFCVSCDYDRTIQPTDECPECGNWLAALHLRGVYLGPPREYPKERPEKGKDYLVHHYALGWYKEYYDYHGKFDRDGCITHWLPMPPPPPSPTRKAE